ncbi:unnamed protein product [Ceratitis capitata]|uniref:(Mediterranean fruit fly) hypothetical protein n=1 Tax=Ceratitis capitata TaxID=7213 RepID=A0A811UZW2_CERCA|nr:unnamed protein product [Ceratitis capitata]
MWQMWQTKSLSFGNDLPKNMNGSSDVLKPKIEVKPKQSIRNSSNQVEERHDEEEAEVEEKSAFEVVIVVLVIVVESYHAYPVVGSGSGGGGA